MPATLKFVLVLAGAVVALILGIIAGRHSARVQERRKRRNERPPPSRLAQALQQDADLHAAREQVRAAARDPDFVPPMPDPAQLMRPLDETMAQIQDRINEMDQRQSSWLDSFNRLALAPAITSRRVTSRTISLPPGTEISTRELGVRTVIPGQNVNIPITEGMTLSVSSEHEAQAIRDLLGGIVRVEVRTPANPDPKSRVRHVKETPKEPPKPKTWHERLLDDEDVEAPCPNANPKKKG